jgi:hypothetical protein
MTDLETLIEILMSYAQHLTPQGQTMRLETLKSMKLKTLRDEAQSVCLGQP